MTFANGGFIGHHSWPCPDHGDRCNGYYDREQVIKPNGSIACESSWVCTGIPGGDG